MEQGDQTSCSSTWMTGDMGHGTVHRFDTFSSGSWMTIATRHAAETTTFILLELDFPLTNCYCWAGKVSQRIESGCQLEQYRSHVTISSFQETHTGHNLSFEMYILKGGDCWLCARFGFQQVCVDSSKLESSSSEVRSSTSLVSQ